MYKRYVFESFIYTIDIKDDTIWSYIRLERYRNVKR